MINSQDIQDAIYKYIAGQMKCNVDELHSGEMIFVKDDTISELYVKILSVRETDVITVSNDIYQEVLSRLSGKCRDELYESDFVFGQTIHYVPDLKQMNIIPYVDGFSFELLFDDEIQKLKGIQGFDNSLSFDEDGNTPTCIVLYAKKDEEIIALAGASIVNDTLREVGIDVIKEYRGKGLAKLLVHNLTVAILKQEKVPFYSASVTNIASQAVAIRSGYMPLWTDTFGTRDIR